MPSNDKVIETIIVESEEAEKVVQDKISEVTERFGGSGLYVEQSIIPSDTSNEYPKEIELTIQEGLDSYSLLNSKLRLTNGVSIESKIVKDGESEYGY